MYAWSWTRDHTRLRKCPNERGVGWGGPDWPGSERFVWTVFFAVTDVHLFKSQPVEDAGLSHLLPGRIIRGQKEKKKKRNLLLRLLWFYSTTLKHLGVKSHLTFRSSAEHLTMHNCFKGVSFKGPVCEGGVICGFTVTQLFGPEKPQHTCAGLYKRCHWGRCLHMHVPL